MGGLGSVFSHSGQASLGRAEKQGSDFGVALTALFWANIPVNTPLIDYPFSDFQKNFQELLPLVHNSPPSRNSSDICQEYFAKSGMKNWRERAGCFYSIMAYMDTNAAAFNVGKFGVVSKAQSLVSVHIFHAVHHFYTHAGLNEIDSPPPPEFFMDLVKDDIKDI